MRGRLAFILAVTALLAGCTGGDGGAPATTKSALVPAAGGHEFNFALDEGVTIDYSFSATAALTWDLHSHDGTQVVMWDEGTAATGSGSFTAPATNTYSLYWQNTQERPVEVSYTVTGPLTEVSTV